MKYDPNSIETIPKYLGSLAKLGEKEIAALLLKTIVMVIDRCSTTYMELVAIKGLFPSYSAKRDVNVLLALSPPAYQETQLLQQHLELFNFA